MSEKSANPCDLCKKKECEDCVFDVYAREIECVQYGCFINYEGSCLLGLYERCGAWKGWRNDRSEE